MSFPERGRESDGICTRGDVDTIATARRFSTYKPHGPSHPTSQAPPQGRPTRLGAQPLIAQHQLAARAGRDHAFGVSVPPARSITFGRDQHMLGEGGKMMTTKRTAIRGRLAVRRAANRPPWGRWKSGHRTIVAPLATTVAATLAASVAIGVGVALARASSTHLVCAWRRRAVSPSGAISICSERAARC